MRSCSLAARLQDRKTGVPEIGRIYKGCRMILNIHIYAQFRAHQSCNLAVLQQDRKTGGPEIGRIYNRTNIIQHLIIYSQFRAPQSCDLAVLQQDRKIARLGGPKLAVYIVELISFNILLHTANLEPNLTQQMVIHILHYS